MREAQMSQVEQKRRGPKPKPASEVKRNSFTLRMRDDMRAKLQAAADQAGRPMSEEAERRIETSFQIEAAFGSGARLDILQSIALTMKFVERLKGCGSYDTHAAFIEVKKAVNGTLDQFMGMLADRPPRAELVDALMGTGRIGQAVADVQIMAMEAGMAAGSEQKLEMTPQQRESLDIYVREMARTHPELAKSSDGQASQSAETTKTPSTPGNKDD